MLRAPYLVPWIIRWKQKALSQAQWKINTTDLEIALTFDDGPSRFTPKLLDVLRDLQATCTFFVLGDRAEKHPDIMYRMQQAGHHIGLHGYRHLSFTRHPLAIVMNNLQKQREVLSAQLGWPENKPLLCRPPFGHCRQSTLPLLRSISLQVVMYGVLPGEHLLPGGWRESPDAVCDRVMRKLEPGLIVALHDGEQGEHRDHVYDALEIHNVAKKIIIAARSKGYRFVPIQIADFNS